MKRILLVGLLLALVMSLVLPTAALAAKPPALFSASGYMYGIDEGNVKQLGNGLWKVKDRHIVGQFLEGDLGTSDFILTYDGIFEMPSQAGWLLGELTTDSARIQVRGITEAMVPVQVGDNYYPRLNIYGDWVGKGGLKAQGLFNAYFVFETNAEGHVIGIIDSSFVMTGRYTGRH